MLSLESGDWLLILDNYDDKEQIRFGSFIPAEAAGSILITTRDRNIIGPVASSGLHLTALDEVDAEQLFIRLSTPNIDSISTGLPARGEGQVLKKILRELHYFPLAIDQAASFIRENSPMTLQEYLNRLEPRSLDRERLMRFKQARPDYPESIMTTWEISLQHLNRFHPRAASILQLLGFMDNKDVSEELLSLTVEERLWAFDFDFGTRHLPEDVRNELAYLKGDVGFRVAIGTLSSLSLVQGNAELRTLSVHPLVHEWIRVRLNIDPNVQAKWTIAASMVLFQTLPLEVLVDPQKSFSDVSKVQDRVNRAAPHIRSILMNLHDYSSAFDKLPVECYILCEILQLGGNPNRSLYGLDLADALPKDLNDTIKSLSSRLSQDLAPLATFIHRLIIWAQSQIKRRNSARVKHQMADVLATLRIRVPLDHSINLLLLLLTTAVIDVSECTDSGNRLHWSNPKEESLIYQIIERNRASNERLFKELYGVLDVVSASSSSSPLFGWIHVEAKRHLLALITAHEFKDYISRDGFWPSQLLSSESLAFLPLDAKAAYLQNMLRLFWLDSSTKNFESVKKLFSVAHTHWKVFLVAEQRRMVDRMEQKLKTTWSSSEYVSSSFGRSAEYEEERKLEVDLITPLSDLWLSVFDVAIAISDPDVQWATLDGPKSSSYSLSLAKRKWAEALILRMGRLHANIAKLGYYEENINVKYMSVFSTNKLNHVLIQIYTNTEEWQKAQRLLLGWLQCNSIIDYCNSQGKGPLHGKKKAVVARFGPVQDALPPVPLSQRTANVGGWEIPESCFCIFNPKVTDVIQAFITVAANQDRFQPEEIRQFEDRLATMREAPFHGRISDSEEALLGRLGLIYYLAEKYQSELPANIVQANELLDLKPWRLHLNDESNPMITCESPEGSEDNDIEEKDEALGMNAEPSEDGLDWEW